MGKPSEKLDVVWDVSDGLERLRINPSRNPKGLILGMRSGADKCPHSFPVEIGDRYIPHGQDASPIFRAEGEVIRIEAEIDQPNVLTTGQSRCVSPERVRGSKNQIRSIEGAPRPSQRILPEKIAVVDFRERNDIEPRGNCYHGTSEKCSRP